MSFEQINKALAVRKQRLNMLRRQHEDIGQEIEKVESEIGSLVRVIDAVAGLPEGILAEQGDAIQSSDKTHFEQIHECLAFSNAPMTVAEIESATGIHRSSVSAVLYRTHSHYFDSYDTDGKAKAWSLRRPASTFHQEEDLPF